MDADFKDYRRSKDDLTWASPTTLGQNFGNCCCLKQLTFFMVALAPTIPTWPSALTIR